MSKTFSIVYIQQSKDKDPKKQELLQKHASVYQIPMFILESPTSLGVFIKNNIQTTHVFIAKDNTYIHIKNMMDLLSCQNINFAGNHLNQYENKQFVDFDCGYLCISNILHHFEPNHEIQMFEQEMLNYISTIPNMPLNIIQGFNKLNFEASYQKTHICEKCEQSFKSTNIFTFGNMSLEEMIKYHNIVEKQRKGKHVQVALAFMIKDEELKVQQTLSYYKNSNYFPEIFILDTGSTDKTLEKVDEWSKLYPQTKVFVFSEPFKDFSYNRNIILDKAYNMSTCEYIISIDCNDELREQELFIKNLDAYVHFPSFFLTQVWKTAHSDPIEFTNIRVVKNNKAYYWQYRVHEVLVNNDIPVNKFMLSLPRETHLYQYREEEYEKEKSARFKRDLTYFLEDYEKMPEDKRIVYYLSQTYFFNQDYLNCIVYAKKRIELNKPNEKDEEVYQSIFRIAKCRIILNQPLHKIKKWLWYAWEYMKDVEPLLYIAQYYENDDPKTAHYLYQLACDTTKPNFSLPLRHELYNFERYRKLSESYYKLGKYQEAYNTYVKILSEKARPEQKENIKQMINMFYPYYSKKDKPLIVIYGGYFYDRFWNGKMFYENEVSLGGSETMVIKLAHLLSDQYQVYVFTNTKEDLVYRNVYYIKLEKYNEFLNINPVKHLILSRDSTKTHQNAQKTHLWLHDLMNAGELKDSNQYTNIITLSKFHQEYYENILKNMKPNHFKEYVSKIRIIPNIVETPENKGKIKKPSSHRFVYSSCPTRGLVKVLEDFIRIKETYTNAELFIYCDFNNDYVKSRLDVNQLLTHIGSIKGVYNVGRLPEALFLEECKKANYWYYPTDFLETFCITAVQMMNCAVIPLYRPVGSLPFVLQNAGVKVNPEDDIVKVIGNITNQSYLIDKGFEIAKKYSDKNIKKLWNGLLA